MGTWQGRLEARLGSTVAGQTMLRAEQGVGDLLGSGVSLFSRAFGSGEMSERIHREKAQREEFLGLIEEGSDIEDLLGETGSRVYSNATKSLAAVGVAAPAGAVAMFSTIGAESFDNSLKQAENNGLVGAEAVSFAGKTAAVEVGVSLLMGKAASKMGFTTLEESLSPGMRAAASKVASKVTGQKWFQDLTRAAGGVTAEAVEEGLTAAVQQGIEMQHDMRADLDWGQIFEAGATGAVGRGMSGTINKIKSTLGNRQMNFGEIVKGVKAAEEAITTATSVAEAKAAESTEGEKKAEPAGLGQQLAKRVFENVTPETLEKLSAGVTAKEFAAITGIKKSTKTFRDSFADTLKVYASTGTEAESAAPSTDASGVASESNPAVPGPPQDGTPQATPQGPTEAIAEKGVEVQPPRLPLKEFVRDAAEPGLKLLKKYLTSDGLLPEFAARANDERVGKVSEQMKKAGFLARDLMVAAKAEYGGKAPTPAQTESIIAAMQGGPTEGFSPDMLAAMHEMRAHVDGLSRRLRKTGLIDPESDLALTIEENEGSYFTRTYRKHDQKNWADRVSEMPEIMDAARGWIAEQYPEETPEQIDWRIGVILKKDSVDPDKAPTSAESKFLDILKRRKNLPQEIRDLMGEYRDPWVNYTNSVAKLANLVAHTEFMEDVKSAGLAAGVFQTADQIHNAALVTELGGGKNRLLKPLAGYYTDADTAKALDSLFTPERNSELYRAAVAISGYAKWAQTVGNSKTHVRNFLGNIVFAMSNGDMNARDWGASLKTSVADAFGSNDSTARAYVQHLHRLGILGNDVKVSEIREMTEAYTELSEGKSVPAKLYNVMGKAADTLSTVYQMGDAVWKVHAFENKKRQYARAYPDATFAEIDKLAAADVIAHYPTWGKVPKGVRELSKFPLTGSFVSFHSEVIRTMINSAKSTADNLQSENPELRKMGFQRAAGMAASFGMFPAMAMVSRAIFGISDDEDEDVRLFQPPWTRNSDYLYLSGGEDGQYDIFDLGFMNARSLLVKPLKALQGPEALGDRVYQALGEVFDPLGEELLFGKVISALRNKNPDDRPVYNESGTFEQQSLELAGHFGQVLLPGTVHQLNRVRKGFKGEIGNNDIPYDAGLEMVSLMGFRSTGVDVKQSYKYRALDELRRVRDAESGIRRAFTSRGTISPGNLDMAYRGFSESRKAFVDRWHRLSMAAVRLGVPLEYVHGTLKEMKAGKELGRAVMANKVGPYIPGSDTLSSVRDAPDGANRLLQLKSLIRESMEQE